MKLNVTARSNVDAETSRWYREIARQVNALSEGSITAVYNAASAAPTTGTWARGDQIRNGAPAELGTAGVKFVVTHWLCTEAGTPGTWVQARSLTGN